METIDHGIVFPVYNDADPADALAILERELSIYNDMLDGAVFFSTYTEDGVEIEDCSCCQGRGYIPVVTQIEIDPDIFIDEFLGDDEIDDLAGKYFVDLDRAKCPKCKGEGIIVNETPVEIIDAHFSPLAQ